MKKLKIKAPKNKSDDPIANPQHRIVRVSKAGRAKIIATRQPRGAKPSLKYNYYAKRYEFVVEFYDEVSKSIYQVTGDRLDWERIIANLQRAFDEVPSDFESSSEFTKHEAALEAIRHEEALRNAT